MSDFDTSVLWPAFKAVGMLRRVSVKPRGGAASVGDVGYSEPDVLRMNGVAISKEYTIEYQVADFPELGEGAQVTFLDATDLPIPGMRFKVRQPPHVSERALDGQDGTYRIAVLTKQ